MYNRFIKENQGDIANYLYEQDVINVDKYPIPLINCTKTTSDNIVVINISNGLYSTTYVEDMRDYFDWKTLRDRKLKLDKILRNVQ